MKKNNEKINFEGTKIGIFLVYVTPRLLMSVQKKFRGNIYTNVLFYFIDTSYPTILLFQEGYKLEVAMKPPPAVTNAVSWRSDGIK